jgi:hypothetical protein
MDTESNEVAVLNEYKDPIGIFVTTAFGGSIDDRKYHRDLRTLVVDEVEEESGFKVDFTQIHYHDKVLCKIVVVLYWFGNNRFFFKLSPPSCLGSTQMNQFVHLFSVDVQRQARHSEPTTDNAVEQLSTVLWIDRNDVFGLQDWKV